MHIFSNKRNVKTLVLKLVKTISYNFSQCFFIYSSVIYEFLRLLWCKRGVIYTNITYVFTQNRYDWLFLSEFKIGVVYKTYNTGGYNSGLESLKTLS